MLLVGEAVDPLVDVRLHLGELRHLRLAAGKRWMPFVFSIAASMPRSLAISTNVTICGRMVGSPENGTTSGSPFAATNASSIRPIGSTVRAKLFGPGHGGPRG